jgi:hypothetical protein
VSSTRPRQVHAEFIEVVCGRCEYPAAIKLANMLRKRTDLPSRFGFLQ